MKRFAAALAAAVLLCPLCLTDVCRGAEGPGLSAASAILVDGPSGRVLYARDAHRTRPIASITKLMTALVAVEAAEDVTQLVTVLPEWTGAEGSSMYLRPGEALTLEELLYGLLMASGNDAAIAIAGFCGGDVETFVGWMNERAADLGMENTHFVNPNGLNDDDHYSTAADMALLARAVMANETLAKIVATRTITLAGRSFTNHNKLLWQVEGCVGMKTGYTEKAGRTLVSCVERDGRQLIAVTLNAPSDWKDHAALYDYGFQTWSSHLLARAGKEAWHVRVAGSLVRQAGVCTDRDVTYPLKAEERVRAVITLPRTVEAPVRQGAIAGNITFYLEDAPIGTSYLVYSQDVHLDTPKYEGLLQRILHFFRGE